MALARSARPGVFLFVLASGLGIADVCPSAVASAANHSSTDKRVSVRLLDLVSIRRLYGGLSRQRSAMSEGARVGAWTDFTMMVTAVVGNAPLVPYSFEDLATTTATSDGPRAYADHNVNMRDNAAYQLLALGYSVRETADVVSGRISVDALDTAHRMIVVGLGREAAANYLDEQYTLTAVLRKKPHRGVTPRASLPSPFDPFIEKYAIFYNVETTVIRAIIETESAFNPAARSPVGAIGLMQLMPTTARELAVNPFIPEQNIEGGVRYFAQLLRMFGGLELALVAYNGGPGFARRYARGQTALYGETRDYVRRVLDRVNAQR